MSDRSTEAEFAAWLDDQEFQFAKTYADTAPHEYIVRPRLPTDEDMEMFNAFARYIREAGYQEFNYGDYYTYLELDGYKYWTMGNPIPETTVINREPIDGYVDDTM